MPHAHLVRSEIRWFPNSRLLIAAIAVAAVFGCRPTPADEGRAPDRTPVILLTGFEPFGEEKPPNPSWEGIAQLHGTSWQGYQLAAVQIPVVWGAPMQQLELQLQELRPIAIFSFGQGYPGAFAIETKALNQRGQIPDNAGQTPPLPLIVGDGPTELNSSFPFDAVARQLSQQGFTVKISARAGQYLCEETLYSLEILRRRSPHKPVVAFCHVPPLGSTLNDKTVDASTIQEFVLAFLSAWKTTQSSAAETAVSATVPNVTNTVAKPAGTDEPAKAPAPAAPANPERSAVEKLIQNYFKSWSDQRMRDYADCFAENAVIQEVDDGSIRTQLKDPFVSEQTNYHRIAVFRAVEVPVQTSINFEAELARVVVYWKLTAGPRVQYGYDHFTLAKVDGNWKIINLAFYGVKKPRN